MVLTDFDDPSFNPFSMEEVAYSDTRDPYAKLAELRRKSWLYPVEYRSLFTDTPDQALGEFPHYTILGYDKVAYVLQHPEIFLNRIQQFALGRSFGKTITAMDAPEHTRYRRIFQKGFLPNIVRSWGETIVEPVVRELIGRFVHRGKADLIEAFTLHYPFQIIYRQIQLPHKDIKLFHKLAVAQTLHTIDLPHAMEAGEKLGVYFSAMVAQRRAHPQDDLVSLLALAEAEGERLPEDVVVSFLRQLINAAGDTTYRGTSNLLTGLLMNPDQLQAIRLDRRLVPQAIEEGLRWEGPVMVTRRMLACDTQVEGETLKQGWAVDLVQGSANRDETKFANPDKFDIFRDRTHRHFAFGSGPHVCLGQHLARVEMERALNAILDKLPNVRLDPDMPPPVIQGFTMRKPKNLYVKFDA